MKLSRFRKLTWKLLFVYAVVVVLVACADRSPDKWRRWNFWAGLAGLALAVWIRMWAAGHLVKNKILTVTGPYAYVKNPLYIGTFFGMIGFALLAIGDPVLPWYLRTLNWMLLGFGILTFIMYYVPYKKKREGDRLRENFGEAWDHYDRSVPDYFPSLTRYERAGDARWSWAAACDNSEQWTPLAIAVGVAAILFNGRLVELAGRVLQ